MMNVSGEVNPGQMLAIMGPEGSGKSLLLHMLAGRLKDATHFRGAIWYNGRPYHEGLRSDVGFVEQFVYLQESLTVKETLMYAAMLRLPEGTEEIDRIVRVEHVLDSLELTQCANTLVGKAGGALNNERRRLGIGMEMITNPPLLLLDEPTSGLDGAMALRITRTLAAYATAGRTVVATMEQPSGRMFDLFSLLLVLAEGNPIYYGPASEAMPYFESLGHMPSYNCSPAEYLMDLAVAEPSDASIHYGTTMNLVREWRERQGLHPTGVVPAEVYAELASSQVAPLQQPPQEEDGSGGARRASRLRRQQRQQQGQRWTTSWWHQFRVLTQRNGRAYHLSGINLLWPVTTALFALLTGCLWYQRKDTSAGVRDQVGLLFFVQLFWGLLPMLSTIITFLQDRAFVRQEHEAGIYHISAYFLSRILLYLPYEILPPVLFSAVAYWMVGLPTASFGRFVLFTLVLVLDCTVASSIGLAIGAASKSSKQAIFAATVVQLLSLAVVEFLILDAPAWVGWIKYLSFSMYIHRLLLRINFPGGGTYECSLRMLTPSGAVEEVVGRCAYRDGVEFRGHLNSMAGGGAAETVILLCMLVGYRILAFVFLRRSTDRAAHAHRESKAEAQSQSARS